MYISCWTTRGFNVRVLVTTSEAATTMKATTKDGALRVGGSRGPAGQEEESEAPDGGAQHDSDHDE